jgi:hypothetical protein
MHRRVNSSAFSRISDLILPWIYRWDYPGRTAGISEILGTRISRVSLSHWRTGKVMVPKWAVERIASWVEERARLMLDAAAELRGLPRGPGRKAQGGLIPNKRRDERLAREEEERRRLIDGPIPMPNEPQKPESTGCRAFVEARLGRKLE